MEKILELRADAFADDVDVTDSMLQWSEERIIRFFEAGGVEPPAAPAAAAAPWPELPPPQLPLRVLSLHGGGSNMTVNKMQVARLKRTLGPNDVVEFDFLNGTREQKAENIDPAVTRMFGKGPYYGWYGVENLEAPGATYPPELLMDPKANFRYLVYEEALDRLEAHIEENGPYHVLCGFSQGAIMITMLTARRLQRAARGEGPPPSWRCNLLLSALPPRASPYAPMFPQGGTPYHVTPPIETVPCIACMGQKDQFYAYGEKGLKSIYKQLQWFEHASGHECAKEPEVNQRVASAVWSTVGMAPPA